MAQPDPAGNVPETATRTVSVTDTRVPYVGILNITSDNANNTRATINDTLTITLEADETLAGANITALNETFSMNITNNTAKASITVYENHTNGYTTFNITARDAQNNILYVTDANLTSGYVFVDTIKPNLTINGNDIIIVELYTEYIDHGANVTDKDPAYNYTITSNASAVDSNILGTYLIEYMAQPDPAGNIPGNKIKTIIVDDNANPELISMSITSNSTNQTITSGDMITITLVTDEILSNGTSVILGRSANMTIENNIVYISTIVQNNDVGAVTFSIMVQDYSSNILNVTQHNLTSENIIIVYSQLNTLLFDVFSNNVINNKYAKTNDTVTVTLVTDKQLDVNANATIFGKQVYVNITTNNATFETVIDDGDSGFIQFEIAFSDINNVERTYYYTQDNLLSDNVFVDTSNPTIAVNLGPHSVIDHDGNVGDAIFTHTPYVDPFAVVTDNDPNYTGVVSIARNNVNQNISGVYHVQYAASSDNAGNVGTPVFRTVSVLNEDGSIDVILPLPDIPVPVLHSHTVRLNITNLASSDSVQHEHDLVVITKDHIIIKIEDDTTISHDSNNQTNVDFDKFTIQDQSDNSRGIIAVSLGHENVQYSTLDSAVMILFQNVKNFTATPYYSETLHGEAFMIKEYQSSVLDASHAFDIFQNNPELNGSMYLVNESQKTITIWTTHMTYFGISEQYLPETSKHDDASSAPTLGLTSNGKRF